MQTNPLWKFFFSFFSNRINMLDTQVLLLKARLWLLKSLLCNKMPLRKSPAFRTQHQSTLYFLLLRPHVLYSLHSSAEILLYSCNTNFENSHKLRIRIKVQGSFMGGNTSFDKDLMAAMFLLLKIPKLSTHLTTWNLMTIRWKETVTPSILNKFFCKTEVLLACWSLN